MSGFRVPEDELHTPVAHSTRLGQYMRDGRRWPALAWLRLGCWDALAFEGGNN
jgi:hypothetical protein